MSTAGRKSSIGSARRGPQKAHIPYRGDNPEVGKKTGIAVRHVERKSDGFEPFEEIMSQADKRTPPKPKGRKKKLIVPIYEEDLGENGEMSMELDDSPMQYFANSRHPATPSSLGRAGSSSRHIPRTSDVDFDEIPSPRPRGSARKSVGHTAGHGRSSLSRSVRARDLDSDSDPPDNDYGGMDNGGHDNASPQGGGSADRTTHHETSFTMMDQDDNDDDDDDDEDQQNGHDGEEEPSPPPLRRGKGKERALSEVPEEPEEEVEDEIAQALDDIEQGASDDDEAGEELPEPEPRRSKKAKFAVEEVKKSVGRSRGKSKKENRPYREGVRKSAREHYKPLEYWRGEKLVYGRSQSSGNGVVLVPPIREIVRIPKEQPEPLGKRKRATRGRSKSKVGDEDVEVRIVQVPKDNPEEGWDDDTETQCVVLDFPTSEEVARRIALTSRMVHPVPAANNDWAFMKVFGDADFIAAGVLVIPPKGKKPSKSTKDNTYVFYVIEGAVNLKVHNTSLVLATGAMFLVPRGNTYFIENIADRDAKIFFTQARKMAPTEEELEGMMIPGNIHRDPSRRPSADARKSIQGRSSSAAATTQVDGATTRPMSKPPANKRAASTKV
ncbi:Mif2/CENP-C like-domain-containing protein [Collybia nuda]|uniref:CENP-C homolog n=1 Tax=Collybia nuda TaxID=64659 RepID=A0A9P6CEB5_9AGAR|nr:Mif2/CENP-C like-domain-containing protein [Collybia nuda]